MVTTPGKRKVLRNRVLIAFVVVIAVAGLTAANGPDGPRKPGRGTQRDVSVPGETSTLLVWRNGKYHAVKLPVSRFRVTEPNGQVGEKVVEGGRPGEDAATAKAAAEAQLPPHDPAFDDVVPTAEAYAAAARVLGIDRPPPLPQDAKQ